MDQPNISLITYSLRAFLIALFGMLGLVIGLVLLIAFLGTDGDGLESKTSFVVFPNANGERQALGRSAPVILKINIDGVIGMKELTTEKMRTVLTESREGVFKDDRVKAIFLYINSPGGTSVDSLNIYQMLQDYKERHKVPIIAFVEGLCASGGMMIAASADKIVASEGSIVGSVGVVTSSFFNVSEVLKKYDVQALTITAGKDKDMLNPFRPWASDESASIQAVINYTYDIFVDLMVKSRPKLTKEKLINDYGAKIFAADIAKEYGYIDAANYSYSKAVELTLKAANLKEEDYRVVEITAKSWVSDLFEERSSVLFSGKIVHQLQLDPTIPPELMNKHLYLYVPGAS